MRGTLFTRSLTRQAAAGCRARVGVFSCTEEIGASRPRDERKRCTAELIVVLTRKEARPASGPCGSGKVSDANRIGDVQPMRRSRGGGLRLRRVANRAPTIRRARRQWKAIARRESWKGPDKQTATR